MPRSSSARAERASAPVFAALGDETRLRLRVGTAGLVHHEREGRETTYELDTKRLADAKGYLDAISTEWDKMLARLKAFVER